MKTSTIFISAILLSFSLSAQAINPAAKIVLGLHLDPEYSGFVFPCTELYGVAFCDKVKIKDVKCQQTLVFTQVSSDAVIISCQLSDGRKTVLAKAQGEMTTDDTQDAFAYIPVTMTTEGQSLLAQ
ncbi:hypothetical protein [Bdellovibrio sp. HCB274]|uniref:hypothetical protein n=1 Tax=Bdellovibrio sp. HCB274 TaxID=3394361 RepID=UPI0039B3FA95